MLQRIQTIYLLIAAGVSAGLIFVFELFVTPDDIKLYAYDNIYVFIAFWHLHYYQ